MSWNVVPAGKLRRTQASAIIITFFFFFSFSFYKSTLLWFDKDAVRRNIYIQYTQTESVSSYTNTSVSIWLSTATEQLWSVASTKDISANVTRKEMIEFYKEREENSKKKKKKKPLARLAHTGYKRINAMVVVAACELDILACIRTGHSQV